jgi:hypothetical protein
VILEDISKVREILKSAQLECKNTFHSFCFVTLIHFICRWALYNNTQFGQGMETTTSVITIRGYDTQSCASYQQYPAFRLVQSANFLGNPMLNNPGIIIFSEPNFLGASFFYNGPPIVGTPMVIGGESGSGPNAIRLGSFAITGIAGINQGNYWRLCADVMCITAVCIDLSRQRGNLYCSGPLPPLTQSPFISPHIKPITGSWPPKGHAKLAICMLRQMALC